MENQATETRVLMHTNKGDIKLKLYNDTPLHRDNFIKLVKEGQYNGLLFHRVIKDFMIQGGDVTSKDAPMNKQLGAGDLGYTVPAEFRYPKYFHKKGALCAARTGDEVNPPACKTRTSLRSWNSIAVVTRKNWRSFVIP